MSNLVRNVCYWNKLHQVRYRSEGLKAKSFKRLFEQVCQRTWTE